MAKYNKKLVESICKLISSDTYTISEICKAVGIAERTYYDWQSKNADFADAIKSAQERFTQDMLVECNRSLVKLIKGYTFQEKKTITADTGKKNDDGKPIVRVKEHSVIEKHVAPNLGAIIHYQTNRDPDNWKNRQENKLSGEIGIKSTLESLTNEELLKIINGEAE